MEFHKKEPERKLVAVISHDYRCLFTRNPNNPDNRSIEYNSMGNINKDICLEQIMINNPTYIKVYEDDEIIIKM